MKINLFRRPRGADADLATDPRAGLPPAGADRALFGTEVAPWPTLTTKKVVATLGTGVGRLRHAVRRQARSVTVVALDLVGLGFLVGMGYSICLPLGLAFTGAACLALSWLLDRSA
jgi:hypothetical protein